MMLMMLPCLLACASLFPLPCLLLCAGGLVGVPPSSMLQYVSWSECNEEAQRCERAPWPLSQLSGCGDVPG